MKAQTPPCRLLAERLLCTWWASPLSRGLPVSATSRRGALLPSLGKPLPCQVPDLVEDSFLYGKQRSGLCSAPGEPVASACWSHSRLRACGLSLRD